MDNKKDIIIKSSSNSVFNVKNNEYFQALFKKTEKIATALYMVTDLLGDEEPLKRSIRQSSLGLLGTLSQIHLGSSVGVNIVFGEFESKIEELTSYIEISRTVGIITEMNGGIITRELGKLREQMADLKAKNKAEDFGGGLFTKKHISGISLGESFFKEEEKPVLQSFLNSSGTDHSYKGHDKEDVLYNHSSPLNKSFKSDKRTNTDTNKKDVALKINRRNNILRIIKDRKEVNIKDISKMVTDCSEKTIQRELNSLVGEGILKRIGNKRWSKYSLKK